MKLSKQWLQPPRSFKNRILKYDLAPDGIRVYVNWREFKVGASIFVPCINSIECVRQIRYITEDWDWVLEFQPRIENKLWGVRIWRKL